MSLLDKLNSLVAGKTPPANSTPSQPQPVPPAKPEPAAIVSPRVLVVVIDPIINPATGEKLTKHKNWSRPEDLISTFTADILEVSGGLGRFQIVQRIEVNEFPVKLDGFRYTPKVYLDVMNRVAQPHNPDTVNYQDFLTRYNILQRVANNEIDEVWVFGFPYAGFWESTMGGAGAFFCNSAPISNTNKCPRRFVIMGFSTERGSGETLHSFGHRAEFIMKQEYLRTSGNANLWERFSRYDKIAPGQAEVGTIHYPPNGLKDYDLGNTRFVASHCDDWYNFPNFKSVVKQVNYTEWGGGDMRSYVKWWLKHLPKAGGRINGIANNWWQYVLDPNRVTV